MERSESARCAVGQTCRPCAHAAVSDSPVGDRGQDADDASITPARCMRTTHWASAGGDSTAKEAITGRAAHWCATRRAGYLPTCPRRCGTAPVFVHALERRDLAPPWRWQHRRSLGEDQDRSIVEHDRRCRWIQPVSRSGARLAPQFRRRRSETVVAAEAIALRRTPSPVGRGARRDAAGAV